MNKITKKLSAISAAVLAISSASLSASAVSSAVTSNGSHGYSDTYEWEYSRYVYNGNGTQIGTICYGYDLEYIKEDYCWTKSRPNESKCKAGVKRSGYDSDYNMASYKSPDTWSKSEVTHKKDYNTVYFKIQFESSYEHVNFSSENSSWNK